MFASECWSMSLGRRLVVSARLREKATEGGVTGDPQFNRQGLSERSSRSSLGCGDLLETQHDSLTTRHWHQLPGCLMLFPVLSISDHGMNSVLLLLFDPCWLDRIRYTAKDSSQSLGAFRYGEDRWLEESRKYPERTAIKPTGFAACW